MKIRQNQLMRQPLHICPFLRYEDADPSRLRTCEKVCNLWHTRNIRLSFEKETTPDLLRTIRCIKSGKPMEDTVTVSSKNTVLRRVRTWFLRIIMALIALFALQITVLAFPQLLISNSVESGTITIYYDGTPSAEVGQKAIEVDERLQGSGFYDPSRTERVFFFRSQNLYTLFARLTMVTPLAQGFAISAFGNSYVSASRVAALAEKWTGSPKYSLWEGSPAHIIAHEIGHQYMIDLFGRRMWQQLPHWKQEGFPEYIANIAVIREDSLATLSQRVGVLNSDRAWRAFNSRNNRPWDRIHYEAELLVEFLLNVQRYTIDEIVEDSITRDETLAAMTAWCDAQQNQL